MNPQAMYSQAELDKHLFDAANALRGPIDPADFKAYIFPLLFLKRISDTWKWEYAQLMEDFDDEEVALDPKSHRFVVPEGCTWGDVLKLNENVGAGLQNILNRLEEANPNSLAGVFGNARWADKSTLPEARLTAVIDVFSRLTLDPENVPHDLLGNAYEYLLKNFADESGKKAGEFFTPRAVVHMLVQLLDPQEGESIYDPTCGSGGMLVDAVNSVRAAGGEARSLQLYGQEVQSTTAAIARMNLYLHDIETFEIKIGDTLRDPKHLTTGGALRVFDTVIANPPFSLKSWGNVEWAHDPYGRSKYGVPPRGYGDLAFVEHMVASMSPATGRVAVVMPHGVLFRSGAEQKIRKNLVEAGLLEAVIGLPPNLFYNTSIPACVLVFRAQRREALARSIALIDASERFLKGKNQNAFRPEDSDAVVQAFRTLEDPDGDGGVQMRIVSFEEIAENDFDLNLGRYMSAAEAEAADVSAALDNYEILRSALRAAESELDEVLAEAELPRSELQRLAFSEVVDFLPGYPFASEFFNEDGDGRPLIRIRDLLTHGPTTFFSEEFDDRYLMNAGDVLIGMDGTFETVKWKGPDALLNQRVIRVRSADEEVLATEYLRFAIESAVKAIERRTSKTTVKHLSMKELRRIEILAPPVEVQRRIALTIETCEAASAAAADSHQALRNLRRNLLSDFLAPPEDGNEIDQQIETSAV